MRGTSSMTSSLAALSKSAIGATCVRVTGGTGGAARPTFERVQPLLRQFARCGLQQRRWAGLALPAAEGLSILRQIFCPVRFKGILSVLVPIPV